MALPNGVQFATRPSLLITWLDADGAPMDLTNATISALILKGTSTRAATGTFTLIDSVNGTFRWDRSEADVATSGNHEVQFNAAFGTDPTPAKTFKADWYVEKSLAISESDIEDISLFGIDTANPASDDYLLGVDVSAANGIRKFALDDDWRYGRLGVGVIPTNRIHVVGTGASEKDFYIHHTLGDGTGLASTYRPVDLQCAHNATDIATTTLSWSGIRSGVTFGSGGLASTGKAHNFSADMVIQGCGDGNTEYSNYYGAMRYDLGTGYDQTVVPTGRGWFTDWSIHGPIAAQPDMLNGVTMFYNNYYNGSPADSPAAAMWIVTRKGSGGALDANHTTANTYPVDVGLGIVGDSNAGASAIGWTKAIQIGGFGSGWKESGSSYIGTGIDITDHSAFGIYIHNRHASGTGPAIAVDTGAGPVVVGDDAAPDATAIFHVVGPNAATSPLVFLGSTAFTQSYQVKLRNASGQHNWAVVGGAGNYLTGTAAGDAVLTTTTSGKALHLGGSTKVITVTSANTLGFFAATPIAQPVLATGAGATADNIIAVLQNLGLVKQA